MSIRLSDIARIRLIAQGSEYVLPSIGRSVTESVELIAVEGRALSGKLRRDVQAYKKTWDIQYKGVGVDVLRPLIEWVNSRLDAEVTMEVTYDITSNLSDAKSYTVLLSPIAYGQRVLAPPFGGGYGMYDGIALKAAEV
jgi:hypothetical protein